MADKKKRSYVLFILDESSSMSIMRKEAIDGFNQHLKDIKKSLGNILFL